jgi:hypothetical protein
LRSQVAADAVERSELLPLAPLPAGSEQRRTETIEETDAAHGRVEHAHDIAGADCDERRQSLFDSPPASDSHGGPGASRCPRLGCFRDRDVGAAARKIASLPSMVML